MAIREVLADPKPSLRSDSSHTRNWFAVHLPEDRLASDERWTDLLLAGMEPEGELPGFLRRRITSFGQLGQQAWKHGEGLHGAMLEASIDTSWSHSARLDEESSRHLEAAAVMDRYARGLLWEVSERTFVPGPEVVEFADDYDGLRAVLRVVRAGWATAAPDGLIVTDHGRDVARRMFVDR